MSRPSPETIGPRYVADGLVKAEELLAGAERATLDRAVRDAIAQSRKALRPAVDRARLILKDAALRGAKQADLLDPTQGGPHGGTD